jgi:hypothetical protein
MELELVGGGSSSGKLHQFGNLSGEGKGHNSQ